MTEATRARVHKVATTLDYRPNQQAAALRRRTTNTIGFVMVPDLDPSSQHRWAAYNAEQLYSLVSEAANRGFNVSVIPENRPGLVESSHIDALYFLDIRAEGPVLLEAFRIGIPVLSNDVVDNRIDIVVDSGYAAFTRHALDLLAGRGAKSIGLLTEPLGTAADEVAEHTYREWSVAHGRASLVARGNYGRTDTAERVDELIDGGCDGIYSFYEEGPAIQAAIVRRGLSVPGDVKLIAATTPQSLTAESAGITSIVYHPELIANRSFDALVSAISDRGEMGVRVELPWEVLEAASTAI
jgi:DNA-binding LacI/PurR family transcriptional regulator